MSLGTLGEPLDWTAVLPLLRALRDIANATRDPEAEEVARAALAEVFGAERLPFILADE